MAYDSTLVRGTASLVFQLCACVLLLALPVEAQTSNLPPVFPDRYYLKTWQTEDGLADNNVTGIAQTGDGYLWVTTSGGISRFDGARFQHLSKLSSDPTHYSGFQSVSVDERGKLWVVADNGAVSWLNPEANEFGTLTKGLVNPEVQSLVVGEGDEVWVSHSVQYARVLHLQGKQATSYGGVGVFPGHGPCTLAQGRDGRLWFAQRDGLGCFREGRWVQLLTLPGLQTRITTARSGGVWLSSGNQVWRFLEGEPLHLKAEMCSAVGNIQATAMLEDRAGRLWLGTSGGELFCLQGTNVQRMASSLPQVACLFEDAEGSLWVGTRGGGLSRLRPLVVEMVSAEGSLPSLSLLSVCEDTAGKLWVTTANGVLARQNEPGWTVLSTNHNWPGGQARCLVADRAGGVWIGTRDSGLYHWENGNYAILRKTNGLAGDSVCSLLLASNGDLWIGTGEGGIQRLREGRLKGFKTSAKMFSVRAMAEDASGQVWMGTFNGVLLKAGEKGLTNMTERTAQPPIPICSLATTPDGSVWIGYLGGGLGRLKGDAFGRLGTERGLRDNYIVQILPDGRGHLWLVGRSGLFRVPQEGLEAVLEGTASAVQSMSFGRDDGLRSVQPPEIVFPSAIPDSTGRLLFALRTGLVAARPEMVRPNPKPPPVLIERVLADDKPLGFYSGLALEENTAGVVDLRKPGATLRAPSDYRKVEIEFTAPSFISPEKVHFRCRLHGFDPDWVELGSERHVAYTRVPPGNYRFQLTACNSDGVWNELGAEFGFVVPPFFWQTWWFRLLAGAALIVTPVWFIRSFERRRARRKMEHLERQHAVDRERARIARDIHDELGAGLTQIGLLSNLGQSARTDVRQAREHFSKITERARNAIMSLDEIVWAVNPRNDNLPRMVDFLCHLADDCFEFGPMRCRKVAPPGLPPVPVGTELRHHLALAVKEALANALKHSGAQTVWLRIDWQSPTLRVVVEDDGRGFDYPAGMAERNGLRNQVRRMEEIGGTMAVQSKPGHGTRIEFCVQLGVDSLT